MTQLKPGLYIISTPIGNLEDITLRAINTLQKSDYIFCEDSRNSIKLLAKHNITTPLRVYNDHSDKLERDKIKSLIQQGKAISLISDAGTPLISDPGYKLVRELKNSSLYIDVVPGPCAAIAALTLSAIATDQFMFCGFLPKTVKAKENLFRKLQHLECSLIFYEAPSRIVESCSIAAAVLGNRLANISRELTKLHQESLTLSLSELQQYYTNHQPKGEIVLIVSGCSCKNPDFTLEQIHQDLKELLADTNLSKRSITDILYNKYKNHIGRKEIYDLVNK